MRRRAFDDTTASGCSARQHRVAPLWQSRHQGLRPDESWSFGGNAARSCQRRHFEHCFSPTRRSCVVTPRHPFRVLHFHAGRWTSQCPVGSPCPRAPPRGRAGSHRARRPRHGRRGALARNTRGAPVESHFHRAVAPAVNSSDSGPCQAGLGLDPARGAGGATAVCRCSFLSRKPDPLPRRPSGQEAPPRNQARPSVSGCSRSAPGRRFASAGPASPGRARGNPTPSQSRWRSPRRDPQLQRRRPAPPRHGGRSAARSAP